MWRDAWFVGLHDVRHMLRRRETVMWTFVMPVVFFFFIGSATGGFGSRSAAGSTPITLVVPGDAGFLAGEVARQLEARGYAVQTAAPGDSITTMRHVVLPPHFTDSLVAARPVAVRLERRGQGLGLEFDQVRVTRGLFTVLADVAIVTASGPATPEAVAAMRTAPRPVRLEVSTAGRRRTIPTGFAQAVPGTIVMFILLVMLTSSAVLLVLERREGLLRRLASTPMSRGSVVLGKWIGRMTFGVVQLGFAMIAGTVLFRMDWGPNAPWVVVLLIVYAGFNASLGLLMGSVARSEGQVVAIGVLSSNLLAALGGCWWPIEVTPEWMQRLSLFLPTGIAMDALHQLVSFGAPAATAVPHVAVLALAAIAMGAVARRKFRFS